MMDQCNTQEEQPEDGTQTPREPDPEPGPRDRFPDSTKERKAEPPASQQHIGHKSLHSGGKDNKGKHTHLSTDKS